MPWVQSLALELPHAAYVAKRKERKKKGRGKITRAGGKKERVTHSRTPGGGRHQALQEGRPQTIKMRHMGAPVVAQQKRIRPVSMRMRVRSLASLHASGIWHCHELWCRSADSAPSLGTSICHWLGQKKKMRDTVRLLRLVQREEDKDRRWDRSQPGSDLAEPRVPLARVQTLF